MTEAPAESQPPAESKPRPLLLVLGAIAVLVLISTCAFIAVASVQVESSNIEYKTRKAQVDMRAIQTAMQLYKIDHGAYPGFLEDLVTRPVGALRWRGPYLGGRLPVDPWGNAYAYQLREDGFILTCYGSDSVPGGRDDQADVLIRQDG